MRRPYVYLHWRGRQYTTALRTMNQAVDALAERAIREHWEFIPTSGSRIGRREYDGRLPDFSAGRVRRRVQELQHRMVKPSK